jgi:hypothetical protein
MYATGGQDIEALYLIYIYIYIYVCVCVCVCVYKQTGMPMRRSFRRAQTTSVERAPV